MKTININGKDFTIEELNKLIEDSEKSIYPIYCQLINSGKVVKFTDLRKGILVKNESNSVGAERVNQTSNHYLSHDNKNTWKPILVCPKTGFFHGQLVWAWNNEHTHYKVLGFYSVTKIGLHPANPSWDALHYENYTSFEGNWPDWVLEAYKTLDL